MSSRRPGSRSGARRCFPPEGSSAAAAGISFLFLLAAVQPATAEESCPDTYQVRVLPPGEAIHLDGALDEPAWAAASALRSFTFPWEARIPPATEFRALHDRTHLFLAFRVEDPEVVFESGNDEMGVARGDRVEIFLSPDPGLAGEYFCVEIDPRGKILDYRGRFYRQFDFAWRFPGLLAAASRDSAGYRVEARVSLEVLASLGLPLAAGHPVPAGLYRAEFSRNGSGQVVESWISWLRPDAAEPDFHIPSSLGCLQLDAP